MLISRLHVVFSFCCIQSVGLDAINRIQRISFHLIICKPFSHFNRDGKFMNILKNLSCFARFIRTLPFFLICTNWPVATCWRHTISVQSPTKYIPYTAGCYSKFMLIRIPTRDKNHQSLLYVYGHSEQQEEEDWKNY